MSYNCRTSCFTLNRQMNPVTMRTRKRPNFRTRKTGPKAALVPGAPSSNATGVGPTLGPPSCSDTLHRRIRSLSAMAVLCAERGMALPRHSKPEQESYEQDESQALNSETAQQKKHCSTNLAQPGGLSSFMGSLQSRRPWSYIYWIAPHGTEGRVEWDGQRM